MTGIETSKKSCPHEAGILVGKMDNKQDEQIKYIVY